MKVIKINPDLIHVYVRNVVISIHWQARSWIPTGSKVLVQFAPKISVYGAYFNNKFYTLTKMSKELFRIANPISAFTDDEKTEFTKITKNQNKTREFK